MTDGAVAYIMAQLAAVEFSPEYFTVERTFVLDSGPAIRFAIASAAFGG